MSILAAWEFSPEICLPLLALGGLYLAGLVGLTRRRARGRRRLAPSVLAFPAGLVLLYLALQSPLDALTTHFFFVHQIQHQLLLQIVPALLVPVRPGILTAGLPHRWRQRVVAPILRNRVLRALFRGLTHPAVACFLAVAVCWFWNLPPLNDRTVADPDLDELAHMTMLFAGFLFWWRILDPRPPPLGSSYLTRLFMLKIAMMSMALFGGYLTMKQVALYGAYDRLDLMFSPVTDEAIGGAVLWLGGSIAPLVGAAIVARRWLRRPDWEERAEIPAARTA